MCGSSPGLAPAGEGNGGPDQFHRAERPRALQESVGGTEQAGACKRQDEARRAVFIRVANHHRGDCEQSEDGEWIQSVSFASRQLKLASFPADRLSVNIIFTKSLVWVVAFVLLAATDQPAITILGEVSDSQCAFDVHSNSGSHDELMKSGLFGHTSTECIRACVRFGGKFVLVDKAKNKIYHIANPDHAGEFAAKQVRVRGTLDPKGVLTILEISAQ